MLKRIIVFTFTTLFIAAPSAFGQASNNEFYALSEEGIKILFCSNGDGTCSVGNGNTKINGGRAVSDTLSGTVTIPGTVQDSLGNPYTVTSINAGAFGNCKKITGIVLPNTIKTIGSNSFRAVQITKLVIPEGVDSIARVAFYNISALKEVSLPSTLRAIGDQVFYKNSLEKFIIRSVPNYPANKKVFGGNCTIKNVEYYNSTEDKLKGLFNGATVKNWIKGGEAEDPTVIRPQQYLNADTLSSTYEIPNEVTTIGKEAFKNTNIEELTIPSSVTSIGKGCFADCKYLEKVTFNATVASIPDSCFINCPNLKTFILPESSVAETIGDNAFKGCTSLTDTKAFTKVTTVGESAFSNCKTITSLDGLANLTAIGGSAFSGCTCLTDLSALSKVTNIGNSVFSDCTGLTSLTGLENVTTIGESAFAGCTNLSDISALNNVKTIDNGAFSGSGLTSLKGIENVNSIGAKAFENCKSLKTAQWPSEAAAIPEYAFYNCSSLDSITLSASLTSIGSNAFKGTAIKSLDLSNTNVASIGTKAFDGCSKLSTITIPSTLTSIGYFAFRATSVDSLDFSNANGLSIGDYAFQNCKSLSYVKFPETSTLGNYAFAGCTGLKSLTLTKGMTITGYGDNVRLASESNYLGYKEGRFYEVGGTFKGCTGLTELNIEQGVTTIANAMFSGCSGLTKVIMPSTIKEFGCWPFENCTNLKYLDCSAATEFKPTNAQRGIERNWDWREFNFMPLSTIVYLAPSQGSTTSSIVNIIIKDSVGDGFTCQNFKYYPSVHTEILYPFTAERFLIDGRTLSADSLVTLNAPFAIDSVANTGTRFFEYDASKDAVDGVSFNEVTRSVGNVSYIIQPSDTCLYNVDVPAIASAVGAKPSIRKEAAASTGSFIGATTTGKIDGDVYVFDGENFVKKSSPKLNATEAYLAPSTTVNADTLKVKYSIIISPAHVNEEDEQVTISNKWTTFCSTDPVDFTSWEDNGIGAYYVSRIDEDYNLVLSKVKGVEAETGVILYNPNEEEQVVTVVKAASTSEIPFNYLKGVVRDSTISQQDTLSGSIYVNYFLTRPNKTSDWAFYKVNSKGTTIPAGKAYLQLSERTAGHMSDAKGVKFVFDDETTGIRSVDDNKIGTNQFRIYDLQGRYVGNSLKELSPGLYIQNGKKILKK